MADGITGLRAATAGAFSTQPLGALVDRGYKPRQLANEDEVWSLNLDQIESHSGRVLSKCRMSISKLGPSTFAFDRGTVLYCKLRPYLNKVVVADDDGVATTELVPLRCDASRLDAHYLAHFLRGPDFLRFATNAVAGAKMPRMVMSEFWKFPVPLPSLPEQRRIAAILDQADALRAKRREALAQLDSLTQSIFIEMFGDAILNTKQWRVGSLESVATFFAGNSLPEGVPYECQEGGHFLMKVSDMNLPENEQFIHRCQSWTAKVGARAATCPAGSVVVPKRGGAIGTNKKRITTRPTILDPNLMAIAPRESVVDLSYLYHWFMRFDLASISSGSSVPQLNKQDLAPLKIQLPPLDLQLAFATRIQAIDSLKATHRAALAESDALFASLQHRAFAGSL